jgi:hypothetical protein
MPSINHVDDHVVNTTQSTRFMLRRPVITTPAPLPAQAHSGLTARISQLGLASHMDAHPAADRFDDPHTDDAPKPDESKPDGWSDPDWPSDGMLNTSNVDIWMWLKQLSPKSRPTNSTMWASLISLFSKPGRWSGLVEPWECLTPQTETLRGSVTSPFLIAGRDTATIPHSEIARWLATYGGLTPDCWK